MNAEQVIEKILNEARGEADRILAEARDKVDRQQQEQQASLNQYRDESRQLADRAAEDKRDRMLAAARMDVRKQTLAAKVAILDELFEAARKRLNSLPDDPYRGLMMRLLKQAVVTGDEELIVGQSETRLNGEFVKQANRELAAEKKGSLSLSDKRAPIEGGFLLQHGSIRVNASTDMLIGRLRDEMESEIANELFQDEA